ncbi:MAG: hypothetical protein HZC05_01230 [Candidatus Magasanikbacteria bacterium]|nr:hypothetical protein [Candidatus Magasanikbacteria bacterium]
MEGGTFISIGRGLDRSGVLLDRETVLLIINALRNATIKGSMATGGGTIGRTPEGTDQANEIFEIVRLLEEKKD